MTDKEFLAKRNIDVKELGLSFDIVPRGIDQICGSAAPVFHILLSYQDWTYSGTRLQYLGVCSLSNQNIADLLEVHVNTVKRALVILKDLGIVRLVRIGVDYKKFIDYSEVEGWQAELDSKAKELGINRRLSKKVIQEIKGSQKTIIKQSDNIKDEESELTLGLQSTKSDMLEELQSTELRPHYKHNNNKIQKDITTIEDEPQGSGRKDFQVESGTIPSTLITPMPVVNIAGNQHDLDSYSIELGIPSSERHVLSDAQLKKLKGIDRLLAGGEAKPSDVVDYFSKKFEQIYRQKVPVRIIDPKGLSILQLGFMARYPRDQWLPIIDTFIEKYDILFDKTLYEKYPVPTVSALNQSWLVNLVIAAIKKFKESEINKAAYYEQIAQEERLEALPKITPKFYYYILEKLGEETFTVFDNKYKAGQLNHVEWFDDFEYPLDKIGADILHA